MRHLMGKVKFIESSITDSDFLLSIAEKEFGALVDQETTRSNQRVDYYFKILTIFSVVLGLGDVLSTYMGMNVKVPGKEVDSYVPFALVLAIGGFSAAMFYFILKWCRQLGP